MRLLFALATIAAVVAPLPAEARTFDDQCRAAMAPYYAALLTSARGDVDGTLRHLVALRGRWDNLRRVPEAERPAWASSRSGSVLEAVAVRIEAARVRTVARQIVAAHADLESVRALLRDARAAAGVRTFDDAVTDYHEAMERLTGRTGSHNEIALNADDYAAIQTQVERAATAWAELESSAGGLKDARGWPVLSQATGRDLARLRTATAARNMGETQTAADELKARYIELLTVLGRG